MAVTLFVTDGADCYPSTRNFFSDAETDDSRLVDAASVMPYVRELTHYGETDVGNWPSPAAARLESYATFAGVVVTVLGAVVLAGWVFGIDALKGYGGITMKTNAALSLVASGIALCTRQRHARISSVCAGFAVLVGTLTLSEHIIGWDLGIDELLFKEIPGAAATASPNRMGLNASANFIIAGTAMLMMWHRSMTAARWAQTLSFIGAAFAMLAVTGYVYGAVELYGIARYTGIALNTSIALLVLQSGVLAAGATWAPMAVFASDGAGGTLLRRLTVWVIAAPLGLGYLVILGRQANVFDRGLGMALFVIAVITLLLAVLWRTAKIINVAEAERRRARNAAERANRLKDQFIAMLSHELRTPLNVIQGRVRLLELNRDAGTQDRAATVIARNAKLLARLVEDLLDHSRASIGQFDIAPVPSQLNPLVVGAIETVMNAANAKGISLTRELDTTIPTLSLDPQRIHQIALNLVSNAVKFTPPGGAIHVQTKADEGAVTVTVADTGIGFDSSFAPLLFEPFQQADASTRREQGGLGLGLSIARHLAELHGGTITASSGGFNQGATFVLTLPVTLSQDMGRAAENVVAERIAAGPA
jgi:signal transduction histidine kinase